MALLKEKGVHGKCIELQGSLTDGNALNRSKAWHEATDESGVIETLKSVPTEWSPDLFRSGTVNSLRAHPEAQRLCPSSRPVGMSEGHVGVGTTS